MDISKIGVNNRNIPHELDVIIEIPANESYHKYEYDKSSGALVVDRANKTLMKYPCNYGFIPHTLSQDGDPCDVLVVTRFPLIHLCVIRVRPVAVLLMEDESGVDEKIFAVPISRVDDYFNSVQSEHDIDKHLKQQIEHFFQHYKDLDNNKWVKLMGWSNKNHAKKIVLDAFERAK